MPATFPSTKPESGAERLEKTRAQAGGDPAACDTPQFILIDTSGPRPGALALSFGSLSALLVLAIIVGRPLGVTRSPRSEVFTQLVPPGPLWLPPNPPVVDAHSHENATPLPSGEPVRESLPVAQAQPAAAAVLPRSQPSVLPLPSRNSVSAALALAPFAAADAHPQASDPRNSSPKTLGTLPLPQLLDRETALAAGFAVLTPEQRLALPRVSIRVNAEWLEALPQTQERLYFSLTRPQVGVAVLAYSPATQAFTWERPLRPLWQIRDGERVPALAVLRAAAARRMGASPELVGLYTWHPPELENALRMFVLARTEQIGTHLGPHDVVTVRLASVAGGFVMNLEPVPAVGTW